MGRHDNPRISRRRNVVAAMLCAVCVSLLFSPAALAHSVAWRYFSCRVCGHMFIGVVSVSGSSFGVQLDFKQTGLLPQPWPVQQCPQCNFIVSYDTDKPGGGKYTAGEFAELGRYVLSEEYQSLSSGAPTYGCVVGIAEHVGGVPDFAMANFCRAAFWQTEYSRENENPLADGYLRKMLMYYTKCARADNPNFDEKVISYYMVVEVNRRLGRFAVAEDCRQKVLLLLASIDSDNLGEKPKRLFENITLFTEQQQRHIANKDNKEKDAVFPEKE